MKKFLNEYRIYILICLISILIGTVTAMGWRKLNPTAKPIPPEYFEVKTNINEKFPDFGITGYSSSLKLNDYLANRKVLLVVISSYCGACKIEFEVLKSVNFLKGKGIEVVILGHEEESEIKEFLKQNNLEVPIFDDSHSQLRDRFDLKFTPANFFIINGTLDRFWNGYPQSAEDLFVKLGQ